MEKYYQRNNYLLFLAVSSAFTSEIIGRGIQNWEIEHLQNIKKAYINEIKMAKELIEESPYYRELEIEEKIELATCIVQRLYDEKEEEIEDKVLFRYLV